MGADAEPISVSLIDLISKRIRIIGSQQNGPEYLYEALDFVAQGKVKTIVETYPLAEAPKAAAGPILASGSGIFAGMCRCWFRFPATGIGAALDPTEGHPAGRVNSARLLDGMNRDDVRVVQAGGCRRFALEAAQATRIGGKNRRQDLDGNLAMQALTAPRDLTLGNEQKRTTFQSRV
jgi:hypothetical protein